MRIRDWKIDPHGSANSAEFLSALSGKAFDWSGETNQSGHAMILLDADPGVLYHIWNKFVLRGRPEFHAEWLRDEP